MITTHVLDIARGLPAAGVPVTLELLTVDSGWALLGQGETDADGRLRTLSPPGLAAGTYRLSFDTAAYFARLKLAAFYPEVRIVFSVTERDAQFHLPLLLAPYGYSTYRGS